MNDDFLDFFGDLYHDKNNKSGDDNKPGNDNESGDDSLKKWNDLIHNDMLFNSYIQKLLESIEANSISNEFNKLKIEIEKLNGQDLTPEELDEKLTKLIGEPIDSRLVRTDDGIFREKTWKLDYGLLVRQFPIDESELDENSEIRNSYTKENPFFDISNEDNFERLTYNFYDNGFNDISDAIIIDNPVEKSLEEQLEDAIKVEDYEKAVLLRDEIKKINNSK